MTGPARRVVRNRRVGIGLALVALLVAATALAPLFAPHDPIAQLDLAGGRLLAPSFTHPMGTDHLSRDLFSRVLYGARISLAIALASVVLAVTLGTAVGLAAGFAGGATDMALMRLVDAGLAVPRLFLLVVILGLWGGVGVPALIAILALTGWFDTSRLVRVEVLSLKRRDFVTAARAVGVPPTRMLARHLLPNVLAPVIVTATLGIGHIVLVEAGLSFLGIGVRPPTPSWGKMIADGSQELLLAAPWIAAFPGCAIVITVVAFSLLGDGLRDVLDPRTR